MYCEYSTPSLKMKTRKTSSNSFSGNISGKIACVTGAESREKRGIASENRDAFYLLSCSALASCASKFQLSLPFSLRSKRLGKAFCTFDALFAFLAAGKMGRVQKSAWWGRGKERRKRLHPNPTILKNAPLASSQLDEFIAWQLVNKVTNNRLPDVSELLPSKYKHATLG